jgi:hypothetical protein
VQLPNSSDYDDAFSKLKKFIQDRELLTAYLLRRTDDDLRWATLTCDMKLMTRCGNLTFELTPVHPHSAHFQNT